MITLLLILLVIVSVLLITVILMQSGRGAGLSGSFGGSFMSGAVFGGRGASEFLSKATIVLGIVFTILVVGVNVILVKSPARTTKSVVKEKSTGTVPGPGKAIPAEQPEHQTPGGEQPAPGQEAPKPPGAK